jgi:hypothetical protein
MDVIQTAFLLEEKGLVSIEKIEELSYELTDEGIDAVNNGLPERQLYNKLNDVTDIKELKSYSIEIGHMKQNGWITIENGKVIKNKVASKTDIENFLETCNESKC